MRAKWITLGLALALLCGLLAFAASAQKERPMMAPTAVTELYSGVAFDSKLLELDRIALDEAYHQHLLLLFSVWLKDQAGDPTRFNNGIRIARRAYHQAAEQIDKREKQLKVQ